jgi:hypothetical protein
MSLIFAPFSSGFNIGARSFGAENTMNIEKAKGVGHGNYILAFPHTKTFCY